MHYALCLQYLWQVACRGGLCCWFYGFVCKLVVMRVRRKRAGSSIPQSQCIRQLWNRDFSDGFQGQVQSEGDRAASTKSHGGCKAEFTPSFWAVGLVSVLEYLAVFMNEYGAVSCIHHFLALCHRQTGWKLAPESSPELRAHAQSFLRAAQRSLMSGRFVDVAK